MVTMSGRGTITSRTTVSPNSMIEWMSGALLGLDHVALDRHVGHGQQLRLGHVGPEVLAPLPDEQVGQPDERPGRPCGPARSATTADTRGALNSAARSGMLHGPVLRHRLAEHEDDHDLEDGGGHHPPGAEPVVGQDADQGGHHQLADQHEQQDRVEEALGVLGEADAAPWPRAGRPRPGPAPWPGSCGPGWSRPGPAPAEAASRTTTTTSSTRSVGVKDLVASRRGARRGSRDRVVVASQQLLLASLHPLGLLRRPRGPCRADGGSRGRPAAPSRRRR